MRIRPAGLDDMDFIESAYDHARAFMRRNGNADQWPAHYPSRIDAREDIARRRCFLVEDDEGPLAVFAFGPGPESDYASIDGAWRAEAPYHVIHRLASVRGTGVARAAFAFCAERSPHLRCDTHADNVPMRRALESFGFQRRGTVMVRGRFPREAYDWAAP